MKWLKDAPPWLVWGLALPLIVLNGWLILLLINYFHSLVTIFIGATVLAFILDYPVRWFQRRKIPRIQAIALVFLGALSFLLLLAVTIVPAVLSQLNDLLTRLPIWLEQESLRIEALQRWTLARRLPINWSQLMLQLQNALSIQLQSLSTGALSFGLGVVGSALDFTLTIVVTFYMLLHGDRLWDGVFRWLPGSLSEKLRVSLRRNFHNYIIGQATLASLMGLSMIVTFLVLKVPFGLLFGLAIGVMTLFPFGAVLSIWLISFLIALNNFWLAAKVLAIALLIDQGIESGIAPRLLGRFTGLNPVWVLFALLLGARVAGILGLLLAVPTAGFIKNTLDLFYTESHPSNLDSIV